VTTEELKRLRELCEAQKTFLPYRYAEGFGRINTAWAEPYCRELEVCTGLTDEQGRLVVGAVNALPSLLDEVERLQAELAKVKVENRKLHTDAMFSQTAGEREACAKVAESYPMFGAVVAAAIRARGESEVSRG
jgi:hypothetical protein